MAHIDKSYHNLLDKILQEGYTYEDPNRKGVNRIEIPSYTFRHEFKDGFPAITTKKLHYKNVVTELLWFLKGDTNIKYLVDNGCNIWNKDTYNYYVKQSNLLQKGRGLDFEDFIKLIGTKPSWSNTYTYGDLGPVYGHQWVKWSTNKTTVIGHNGTHNIFGEIVVDQIARLIKNLKEKPLATDHIVNSWNVGDLKDMALPPCHYGFQVVVRPLSKIKCDCSESQAIYCGSKCQIPQYGFELHWQQRSVDTFLGLPFNISSYATLALILEKITGYKALAIQGDLKKVHLYDNSINAVKEQLSRDVDKYKAPDFDAPILDEIKFTNIDEYVNKLLPIDFTIENYESYPHIKVEMLERNK